MTEKELIQQLKTLKSIKPNKEWAILCKQEIIGTQTPNIRPAEEPTGDAAISPASSLRGALLGDAAIPRLTRVSQSLSDILSNAFFKPAFATIACFGLVFTIFGFAQGALPGDALYPAKKITEKVQLNLAAEQEKPDMQIAMTNKKMQELNQVVQANLGKNLAPAIQEVEQSAQETAKTLVKLTESVKVVSVPTNADTTEKGQEQTKYVLTDTTKIKETLAQIQEIKSVKQEVETHGVIVEMPELDEALSGCYEVLKDDEAVCREYVEERIQTMETQILLEEQETLLLELKELYAQEQYQQAFEKLLLEQ